MKVTCVVDDAVQRSSSYWGEHGVAFLIETTDGRVLFDTGQSGTILMHNLDRLGIAPGTIDGVAISHGHYDHTGGLSELAEHLDSGAVLYAHPELFRGRFSVRDGEPESVGMDLTRGELAALLPMALDARPREILPGVWTTGAITERPEKEGSSSYHLMAEGDDLVQDRYLDDMALVLMSEGHLVLLCGCCHAGLLNTLDHVERAFERSVGTLVGGLHLTGAADSELEHICEVLRGRRNLQRVLPNHCTGEMAYVALTNGLGSSVVRPFPAGSTLELGG